MYALYVYEIAQPIPKVETKLTKNVPLILKLMDIIFLGFYANYFKEHFSGFCRIPQLVLTPELTFAVLTVNG
jgi:hypothetical protein